MKLLAKTLILVLPVLLLSSVHSQASNTSAMAKMKSEQTSAEQTRLNYFREVQQQTPDDYRKQYTQTIINGAVVKGMTPYEAYLAGGQFAYRVSADEEVWPAGSDPMQVIWTQTYQPDNSEIWMMFNNQTQYKSATSIPFRVIVEKGLVISVEKQRNE